MTRGLPRLPQPADCPDYIDWDNLSSAAQHGLMARLDQLGRIGNSERDLEFIARLLRPLRGKAA